MAEDNWIKGRDLEALVDPRSWVRALRQWIKRPIPVYAFREVEVEFGLKLDCTCLCRAFRRMTRALDPDRANDPKFDCSDVDAIFHRNRSRFSGSS